MSSIVLALILGAAVSNAQSITALTTSQIDSYNSYTYYASAGYCTNTQTLAWDCGSACSLASTQADDLADDSDISKQPTAKPTRTSNRLLPVVMAIRSSTVSITDPKFAFVTPSVATTGFVGYDPNLDTVIVSHQGTNPEEMFVTSSDS